LKNLDEASIPAARLPTSCCAISRPARHTYHKLPTTTGDPAKAVLDGIAEILDLAGLPREEVEFLCARHHARHQCRARRQVRAHRHDHDGGFRDVIELRASAVRIISISTY
jgi:hypothetical protein